MRTQGVAASAPVLCHDLASAPTQQARAARTAPDPAPPRCAAPVSLAAQSWPPTGQQGEEIRARCTVQPCTGRQVYPNSTALVVSTENITQNWYFGNDRAMLIPNCLFRVGGAAVLLSNKRSDRRRAKCARARSAPPHLRPAEAARARARTLSGQRDGART